MLAILVESDTEDKGLQYSRTLAAIIKNDIMKDGIVIGPASATIKKISDIYRFMIYVKAANADVLIRVKDVVEATEQSMGTKGVRILFDMDPVNGY